jgi:hypothetical protein
MAVQALFDMSPKRLDRQREPQPPSHLLQVDHPSNLRLTRMKHVIMDSGLSFEAMNALLAAPRCESPSKSPPTALRGRPSRAKFRNEI